MMSEKIQKTKVSTKEKIDHVYQRGADAASLITPFTLHITEI